MRHGTRGARLSATALAALGFSSERGSVRRVRWLVQLVVMAAGVLLIGARSASAQSAAGVSFVPEDAAGMAARQYGEYVGIGNSDTTSGHYYDVSLGTVTTTGTSKTINHTFWGYTPAGGYGTQCYVMSYDLQSGVGSGTFNQSYPMTGTYSYVVSLTLPATTGHTYFIAATCWIYQTVSGATSYLLGVF